MCVESGSNYFGYSIYDFYKSNGGSIHPSRVLMLMEMSAALASAASTSGVGTSITFFVVDIIAFLLNDDTNDQHNGLILRQNMVLLLQPEEMKGKRKADADVIDSITW